MGFRKTLIATGVVCIIASYFLGPFFVWVGAPLIFFGSVLLFIDKD